MRPIRLKIKGLNSFIDEQEIDFNKLTERGLFGIFGPTGSGKSTILDGITLALYGDLPRKSTNYINMNCNSLNVSFEFSISDGKTKTYRVEREFKTDKKTGRPKSGKCKVLDITQINPIILAESVKEVTRTCENIIGLGMNDFTKTVVLPQGSFSEFLKISGKDRREMLERLFNLQEYGENLEKKLSAKSKVIEKKLDIIKGKLSSYEDINLDDLEIKENEFKNNEKNIKQKSSELLEINETYEEAKEIFQLKSELNSYENERNIISTEAKDIENKRGKIDNIEKSLRILNFIENYDMVLNELNEKNKNLEDYNLEFENIKNKKNNILKVYNEFLEKKQESVPKLKIKAERLDSELKNRKALRVLEEEINRLNEIIKFLKIDKEKSITQVNKTINEIDDINLNIKSLEKKYDSLKVDRNLKKEIEEALRLEEDYLSLGKDIDESLKDIESFEKSIKLCEDKKISLQDGRDKNLKELKEYEFLLENLNKNCPAEDKDLLNKKVLLENIKIKQEKFSDCKKKIDLNNNKILKINDTLSKLNEGKDNLKKFIELLEKEVDDFKIQSLALKIREKLIEGDICPVCGSTHHNIEIFQELDLSLLESKNSKLLRNKDELLEKEREIAKLEERIIAINNESKNFKDEIKSLGEDFSENIICELQKEIYILENDIKRYKEEKLNLENKLNDIKDIDRDLNNDIKILNVNLENSRNNLDDKIQKRKISLEKFNSLNNLIEEKRSTLKIDDFKEYYKDLMEKENKREELESCIKDKRAFKEKKESERDIKNKEKEEIINSLASNEAALKEKENQKNNIKNNLNQEFTQLENINSIEKILIQTNEEIKNINEYFEKYIDEKNCIEERFEEINNKLNKESLKVKALEDKEKSIKEELEFNLQKENFTNVDEVEELLKEKHTLKELKDYVKNYDDKMKVLEVNIDNVLKKLKNRDICNEELESIRTNKEKVQCELDSLKDVNLILKQEIKNLKEKIEKFKTIMSEKKKIKHDEIIINDLRKLFSGRKFVDYIATERLKYVALEASKRLKEITNNNYSLEINKDGMFIMRDFKNGGCIRDVSTLSGGETFLTSLALSLALSSGLQLKKAVPLELFFLDEGFGTLDDDLLETVVSSLEKIQHEKLKIGIISHVESIKNRVPVKLIVTPAESGMGGSKVKIERN
ncbi:SbcC/MukB-like Walker B domain-containing protein [Sarcina ventriculi]|uniref:SbcC/MukB-like Walker B domain-containing protein n=2 Tax=Sarcina ventriculi TaxID=1267 RepID=UPI001C0FC164|nr:AAA family ATPase [Sarcina ventriculi]MBU5322621.1 AAA family ATPase [Sarcina ventriculi]